MDEDKTKSQTQEDEELEQSASTAATTDEQAENEETQTEETTEEQSQAEETEEEAEEESSEEEEEPAPSPRQNKAIERLTKRLADAEQREREMATRQQPQRPNIEDGEYTPEELAQRFDQYGNAQYQEGLRQAQESLAFQTRLEIDTPKVEQKYEFLNRNSEKFDPGIADYVNRNYLKFVGYDPQSGAVRNPDIRYEEYVDATVEVIETVSALKAADSQKNIAKQVAKQGVRPSGTAKKVYQGDDPSKMDDKQLEATINQMLGITKVR